MGFSNPNQQDSPIGHTRLEIVCGGQRKQPADLLDGAESIGQGYPLSAS